MKTNINDFLEKVRITPKDNYTQDTVIISIDSTPIATLGNISACVGKPKSGKTLNISAIVAAALSNGKVLKYYANLPKNKKRVIYIDTEQSKLHCFKQLSRIAKLANVSETYLMDNLYLFALREYGPKDRMNIIDQALDQINNIGLLVIDGVRDLLFDINCPIESSQLINTLMQWSSKYNIHILTVIHLNKSDDNTRGHLGSELNHKSETVLKVVKSNSLSNLCSVSPIFTRDKEFSSFSFIICNDGLPEVSENNIDIKKNKSVDIKDITENQHHQALSIAFTDQTIQGYNNLINIIKDSYGKIGIELGNNKVKFLYSFLKNNFIITRQDKDYIYNKEFKLNKQI